MNKSFNKYIIFWLSQSVSQLGSSMTGFALILWAYTKSNSALTVSLMSFCNYVPYIIVSLFAGAFVDKHSKKKIMLAADCFAAACSAAVLLLSVYDALELSHIYIVNCVLGFFSAFQSPASAVAIIKIVDKEKIARVSGMNAFSSNLVTVLSPVLASSLFAFGGLKTILLIDLGSFLAAFLVLLLIIHIPESNITNANNKSVFSGCRDGFIFLKQNKGIQIIVLTMALLNFFSRLTYENVLSPMIISRSGNDSMVLGIVNAAMGIGGIVGGIIVTAGKQPKNNIAMIYVSAAVSFLLGDLLMGIGRNVFVWSVAAVAASLPIPFINAGQNVIFYEKVPQDLQGRVFAVRNAIQYSTIPIGILLGGFLADHVFEPFMASEYPFAAALSIMVGDGAGSGMAVMFLCTGVIGSLLSFLLYRKKEIRELNS